MNITILKFDSLESTNTEAIEQVKRGADEGLCVIAYEQTSGRGRHGRTWVSKKGDGLYFSIALRPKLAVEFLPLITLMTAVAVYDSLKDLYDLRPDIKWSNDVLVNKRKICGILAEAVETSKGLAIIVGVGVNLTSRGFPEELIDSATSIRDETGKSVETEELTESLTKFLTYFYTVLHEENGPLLIRKEWEKRSTYFEGKAVRVSLENESFQGTTKGLEQNGALRVLCKNGDLRIIQAGDVERLRANGDNNS